MDRRLSPDEGNTSRKDMGADESHVKEMLARFGPNRHKFNEQDRAKAVEANRRKAAERRERAMSVPEFLRENMDREPERWAKVYLDGRDKGDLAAVEAGMNRAYGRPAQAITLNQGIGGIDPAELDEGDIATLERLILERIQVERGSD